METTPKKGQSRFWRAWIALAIIAASPFILLFGAYGVYSGCKIIGVERGASYICDNAWVPGLLGFAWAPYVLAVCAVLAVLLFLFQLKQKK